MPPCSRFGQWRSKPSTYHRYNSSGSTHEKRTHHAGRWRIIRPSVGFEQIRARGTLSSTYRRRLYARRGANKRMGRVLADGAAYRGGGSSSHFSHFFSLSLFCVRLLRRIMYYLVVTFRVTVVESTHVVWSTGGMAVVGLVHGFSMVEERTANALCTSTLGDAFVLI